MATDSLIHIPGGGLPTEPPDDPADRHERQAERALDALGPCPKCFRPRQWIGRELDCSPEVPVLTAECLSCRTEVRVPIV